MIRSRKKVCTLFLASFAILSLSSPAFAALDTAALEKNVLLRFNTTRPQGFSELSAADIKVIDSQEINVRGIPLYAARIEMRIRPEPNAEPVTRTVTIAVNEGGNVQFDTVGDVATAVDLISPQAGKLMKLDLPSKSETPAITGTGKRVLRMVSDPYCTYCRDAYKWAQANTDKFSGFFIEGFPLIGNLGSEAVVWYMNALGRTSPEEYREIMAYAYSDLPSVISSEGTNLSDPKVRSAAREAVLKNIMERFPDATPEKNVKDLLARLEKDEMKKQMDSSEKIVQQGVTSTPIFRVDETPLRGFHAPTLELLLKDDKEKASFFQNPKQ